MRPGMILALAVLASCGATAEGGGRDASTDSGESADLTSVVGSPCVTDQDCPPGTQYSPPNSAYNMRLCVYSIADGCSAVGHCADLQLPECSHLTPLCGCNGSVVRTGCGYQSGYASGPTTGAPATSCVDGMI
jgi:hypothetical protein